jgi:hypothetical protein
VARWLEQVLDFPNWNAAGLETMPETHIGTWAEKRGVEIDRGYATEVRESGTRALGMNVPAPSRATLCVFTPEEWEKMKPSLTIDHWERHVRARLRRP